MANAITEKEYIDRAIEKYGTKYEYHSLGYTGLSGVVNIVCPEHGLFTVSAREHIYGASECNWCKYGRANKKYTTADFINEATSVHEGFYDYSKVLYKNCDSPVEIICPDHGTFHQSPYNHLRKAGCMDCWYSKARKFNRHTLDEFISKANSVHNEFYSYKDVDYVNNKTKVIIECPLHGDFHQTPHDHLAGNGCRDCAYADRGWGADGYYGTDKPSNLYVVTMSNKEEVFVKVGLAKNIKDRFFHFNREADYQVMLKYSIENKQANSLFKIEQDILHRSGFTRYKPKNDFRGKTECIDYRHINDVIEAVKEKEKSCV